MRIVQINSVCGYGSTGRIVSDLYKVIISQGDECLILYGRGNSPEGINAIKIGSNINNKVHGALTRVFDRHGFGSTLSTRILINRIKEYDPDIIHLHNLHGYYINIEILFNYLKEANKPVIWTLHDCWSFTGHCAHFDYIGCQKWQSGCSHCPRKAFYPKSLFADNSFWNYKNKKALFTSVKNMYICTPSIWLGDLVKQSFLRAYPIMVIYNGIDLKIFNSSAHSENNIKELKKRFGCEKKLTILSVASVWGEMKGLKYIIETAKELGDDYQFIVVGVNEKQKRTFPSNVTGISRTDNLNQLAELYSMADLFVNTTLEEVLGLTNIEALACGTPVLTFNTGGSPECIDDTCGIVVPKGSVDGLVKSILCIEKKDFSSEACRERALLFNKDEQYIKYIELYKKALDQKT